MRQSELLTMIDSMGKYYSKETTDYLKALVMLETTLFERPDFCEQFSKLDWFAKILKYNIDITALETIVKQKTIDIDNIEIEFNRNGLDIGYRDTEIHFDLYESENLGASKLKPQVTITEIGNSENSKVLVPTWENLNKFSQSLKEKWKLYDENFETVSEDKKMMVKRLPWIDIYKHTI